jgi:hypothetical protein
LTAIPHNLDSPVNRSGCGKTGSNQGLPTNLISLFAPHDGMWRFSSQDWPIIPDPVSWCAQHPVDGSKDGRMRSARGVFVSWRDENAGEVGISSNDEDSGSTTE